MIRAIEVRYRLAGTGPDEYAQVQRAHLVHHRACAVSRSVDAAINISTQLELV
jgi:organic hydroperoxide reductase OsmC/OhrA